MGNAAIVSSSARRNSLRLRRAAEEPCPAGVSFLCTSRPRHPYVSSLEARDGDFVQFDLDASESAADNDATVRTFWEGTTEHLGLDARFVDEAVTRAGGNVQHAVQLRRQVAASPARHRS